MRKILGFLLVLPILFLAVSPVASAGNSAFSTIAGIVMHLNHYPSDSEKQTLVNIVHDDHATSGEQTLAGALMRMRHSVQGGDASALQTLASDKQSTQGERELANIILGINHHPSSDDMRRLQSLIGTSTVGKASHHKSKSWGY